MNRLSIAAVFCLLAAGHTVAVEPLHVLEMNPWTGKYRELKNVDSRWLAIASIFTQPGGAETAVHRNSCSDLAMADFLKPQIAARGLRSPDGLAAHPDTGALYVSQEDDAVISTIVGGKPVTVIDASTPIYASAGSIQVRSDPLRAPEGIAFSRAGDLYAVEDRPGGRLIRFTLDSNGMGVGGANVWIPGDWSHVAWEGVVVGPHNELLLSGSSAEDAMAGDEPGMFEGVLLYCDREHNWWLLDRRPLRSFSQAAFSRDGSKVVYACEVTGEINWMDLGGKKLRWGASVNYAAKSPEGICILPDGRVLVAEERGKLFAVDPETDEVRLFADAPGTLETVTWDEPSQRLLATEDRNGTILKWELETPESPGKYAIDRARFEAAHTPRYVPERCPDFLAKVLAFGGVDFSRGETPLAFRVFAGRVPMVAVDAATVPAWPADVAATDPIVRLQAVVFNPAALTVPGFPQSGPLALLIATTRSGKVIKTGSKEVSASAASLVMPLPQTTGAMRIPIPFPGAASVSESGICNMHLMGLGEMPDFHIVLNPSDPGASYVAVDDGRRVWQYQLAGVKGGDLSKSMVISYSKELSTERRWIGRDNRFAESDAWTRVATTR